MCLAAIASSTLRFPFLSVLMFASSWALAPDALAADPIPWRVTASDKQTNAPIEGAVFNFTLTDQRSRSVEQKTCTTDVEGNCEVLSHPTTGFFSGGGTEALVSWDITRYQKHADLYWLPGTAKHLHVVLTSLDYVEQQEDAKKARQEEDGRYIAKRNAMQLEAKRQAALERDELRRKLASAKKDASLHCATKTACEKMFALTEIFIAKYADMKLQLTTSTTLQTANPIEPNRIGLAAYRIPGKRDSSTITLEVSCKNYPAEIADGNACLRREVETTQQFRPFIEALFKE